MFSPLVVQLGLFTTLLGMSPFLHALQYVLIIYCQFTCQSQTKGRFTMLAEYLSLCLVAFSCVIL